MMASVSGFSDGLLSIALLVPHCLEGSVWWSSVSMCFSDVHFCSGDLVIHLLQGGHIRKISGWYA